MGKTTSEMQLVPIGKLVPYVNNARTHSKEQITKLRSSLREFGFVNPVIIDREFNVIAGHGRILAAKEENIEQVPCVFVDHLTEAQKKAYILADNRFALDAGWDEDMLRVEMEALQGMDFDISLTGFDESEIADLFAADDNEAQEDDFDEDAALQAEPFVKPGDLWLLGKHRLLCADSTNTEDVKLLMDGKKANMCITDPPYACNYTGGTGMKIMNDNLKGEEFYQFLLSAFKNAYENLADGAAIYIFHSDAEKVNFYNAVVAAGFHYSTTCIWVKQSLVLGRFDYQMRHEPVIYAFKDTVKHKFYGDRKQTTVWEFDRPSKSKLHPTTKPLPLVAYPMKNSSLVNSIALDLFGGSGSTLMAAEQMDRVAYLMELDPVYASAIVRRFVAYRGNTENVYIIRDGQKLPCSEVYIPTAEELGMKDTTVNDVQKGRKKGG
ncbi:lactate dehydrogenase [Selenomonas sp. oral taxon 126]|uniref:site-specific DNA-methyltransferase n=1 Tax=Selenomonas sp. oral taxon 126 TaxID=712528 RepID=UPI000807759C|nr:site-specific DNA-methyltransferase [Selenomonas sp. oral taxon 126]ANR71281.1 lactate dehydrogenase [Selenomonas sp. oral taxon 126]